MHTIRWFGLVWALLLLTSCASRAPKPEAELKRQRALDARWAAVCRDDELRLCGNWKATDGSPADCLARQEKELSGRCYQVLREQAGPCVFDRARLCGHLKASDPKVWSCLEKRKREVTLACRTHRDRLKQYELTLRRACGADMETHCSGKRSRWRCLREHLNEVSGTCRAEMARGWKRSG